MVLWCFDVEVAGACGCVAPGDVELLPVDTDERGVNAAVGVCGGGEDTVWEGFHGCVE